MITGKYKYTVVYPSLLRDEFRADSIKQLRAYIKWLVSLGQCPKPLNIYKSRPKPKEKKSDYYDKN